jgi:hypothetical protein
MSLDVILPHGKSADLDGVAVIRTVDETESNGYNARLLEDLKGRPDYNGIVPSRRWTVAIEKPSADGRVNTRYTIGTVDQLVNAAPELQKRFNLIDGNRAAIGAGSKAHLIRPLQEREGSDKRAVVYIEGGSSNGLLVTASVNEIKAQLGPKAAHLTAIGNEGLIDRSRIEKVDTFDPNTALDAGQQRFTIAARFTGVYRPQYFVADEATLRGKPVLDLRPHPPAARAAGAAAAKPAPR